MNYIYIYIYIYCKCYTIVDFLSFMVYPQAAPKNEKNLIVYSSAVYSGVIIQTKFHNFKIIIVSCQMLHTLMILVWLIACIFASF